MSDDELAVEDLLKPPAFLDGPLFVTKGTWLEVADLDWSAEYHYVEGYRAAARLAATEATKLQGDVDKYVYPVVVLFRHATELLLKRIIAYQEEPAETHDLRELWSRVVVVVEAEAAGIGANQIAAVEKRIMELHVKDKPATRFRYPYTPGPDPKRTLKGGLNVTLFAERADSLCDELDGWDTAIHEHRNWQEEMREYYSDAEGDYNEP